MSIGNVYISGVIGNSYNADGTISEKGVELVDVVEAVADLGEVEGVNFIINSPGGSVQVGTDIRDFIEAVPNAKTTAKEMCASIATVIHTAVPLQNRFIEEGAKYMIHNPWIELSGDAATLSKVASDMETIEKDLEAHYSKATGTSKQTISAFMASEMWLSNEQCVKLGFASKIIEKPLLKAVAKFQINKDRNMSTDKKTQLAVAMAKIKSKFGIGTEPKANAERTAKAVMIETDQGMIETPFADVQVGDEVMLGDQVAPDGNYTISEGEFQAVEGTISQGAVINVQNGVIASIEMAGAADEAENIASLKAKIEALENEKAELQTKNETLEAENSEAAETLEALAKMGSSAAMPQARASFRKIEAPKTGVTRASMKERKESYRKK